MIVVVEFYRTRDVDDAHAVVGRETIEAAGLSEAIETARQLWITLDMPQRPDAMRIADGDNETLHLELADPEAAPTGGAGS